MPSGEYMLACSSDQSSNMHVLYNAHAHVCSHVHAGCLAYELLAGKPLLKVGTSLSEYRAKMASLGTVDLSGVSPQLQPTLQPMLAPNPSSRPPASAFAGCLYFQV